MSLRKYGVLGSIRRLAQILSFEVNLAALLLLPFLLKSKFNISLDEIQFLTLMIYYYIIFFITFLLEIQRAPMDLAEGERELVRGYNTEYSSVYFTFIFLAEYIVIFFFVLFMRIIVKLSLSIFFIYIVIIIRSCYPRIRYDLLMTIS